MVVYRGIRRRNGYVLYTACINIYILYFCSRARFYIDSTDSTSVHSQPSGFGPHGRCDGRTAVVNRKSVTVKPGQSLCVTF